MSVSSIGSSATFDVSAMANKFFKKADANNDGGIDKEELKTMLANGPGGGKGTQDIDKIFSKVDTNGDGKIDASENEAQMKSMASKGAGGPPPSGGGGANQASATSGSSTDNKVYDAKDSNKDGKVSAKEEIEYAMKHPEDAEAVKSAISSLQKLAKQYTQTGGTVDAESSTTQSLFSVSA